MRARSHDFGWLALAVLSLPACHLADSLDGFAGEKPDAHVDHDGLAADADSDAGDDADASDEAASVTCVDCDDRCRDCDGDLTNGCETDTSSSSSHCGVCNHDCLGGSCTQSACSSVTLASGEASPWAMASDVSRVFWVAQGISSGGASGSVRAIPLAGGSVDVLASDQSGPVDIAIDEQFAFWANFTGGGAIARSPLDGGETKVLAAASAPWSIAVDEGFVYWTNRQDGSVQSLSKSSGAAPQTIVAGGEPIELRGLSVDALRLYWVDTKRGEIRAAPKGGGTVQTLVSGLSNPVDLTLDDTYIYWVEAGPTWSSGACATADGRVRAADKTDGSGAFVLAEAQACPRAIATDGVDAVWANHGLGITSYESSGSIARVTVSGGVVHILAADVVRAVDVVVLSDQVVWASMGIGANAGTIEKVAR